MMAHVDRMEVCVDRIEAQLDRVEGGMQRIEDGLIEIVIALRAYCENEQRRGQQRRIKWPL